MRVGDIVLFNSYHSNGVDAHPAIVTRVWGPDCVNLQVLPDCGAPFVKTSVTRAGIFRGGESFSTRE